MLTRLTLIRHGVSHHKDDEVLGGPHGCRGLTAVGGTKRSGLPTGWFTNFRTALMRSTLLSFPVLGKRRRSSQRRWELPTLFKIVVYAPGTRRGRRTASRGACINKSIVSQAACSARSSTAMNRGASWWVAPVAPWSKLRRVTSSKPWSSLPMPKR